MICATTCLGSLQSAVQTVGLPVLFGVFVLKGALVGKVFPTSIVLPGYVVASGATAADAAVIVIVVTFARIVGQLFLYAGVKRWGVSFLTAVPRLELDEHSNARTRLEDWFSRYGGAAIFATNVLPWSRGVIAIPAAMSSYSTMRYVTYTSVATVVYHSVYVGAAITGVAIFG
jgi:membrane protein DedA with SNARE-associated domain